MINRVIIILACLAAIILILYAIFSKRKRKIIASQPIPENYKTLLKKHIVFYNELDYSKKKEFEDRMQHFLAYTRITGVNTEVEELDKVLIAASAIIPIFGFHDWQYMNLNEVLLYPDSFDEHFNQQGDERTRVGVVGDGPYQNIMILSKQDLRQGFSNNNGTNNTAIHEFVHLIDKTDGAVDGVPEFLISKQYVLPWLYLMQKNIQSILQEQSDINSYGATNPAEFFAVVSEYFFNRPDLLQEKHPELYRLLTIIFRREPKKD